MHPSPELVLDLGQLRPHPLRDGLAPHREPSGLRPPADVGRPKCRSDLHPRV